MLRLPLITVAEFASFLASESWLSLCCQQNALHIYFLCGDRFVDIQIYTMCDKKHNIIVALK